MHAGPRNFLWEENSAAEGYHDGNISSLIISYHKDGFPHSLNAVEEDVEAEAAEETGTCHSLDYLGLLLGPSSLSSSVISSASLDETMNVGGECQGLAVCKSNHMHNVSTRTKLHSRRGASEINCEEESKLKTSKLSGVSCKASSAPVRYSPRNQRISSPSQCNLSSVPLRDEYKCDRAGCKGTPQRAFFLPDKNKTLLEKKFPIWHNPSKSDKNFYKSTSTSFRRDQFQRAKSEARETVLNNGNKYSSLPRKKKTKSEKDIVAETYGTLERNRKPRVPLSTGNDYSHGAKEPTHDTDKKDLHVESKNILDKYATMPRKKAREISARWRDQTTLKDHSPQLKRSKSTGKGESSRSDRFSPSPAICLSASSASLGHSPRISHTTMKQSSKPSSTNTMKAKTYNSPSAKLLARQGVTGKEKSDKAPSAGIYGVINQPKLSKTTKKNVEIQVNIKWNPNESELEDKLRNLAEEYGNLQVRLKRAEATVEEVEQLRMEAVELRRIAETEKMEKEELQEELDRTSGRVKDMLTSMEGVEREFNDRGESLIEMEHQLLNSSEINVTMQEKLNQYEEYIVKLKQDLDKSLAAQKIFLQQVQDLEAESREIAEFMSEEKNALSECLKESDLEIRRQRAEVEQLHRKLLLKDEEVKQMLHVAEERRRGCLSLQTEMTSIQLSTQDIMVYQGADISGASVELTNLISRLQIITDRLIHDYSISDNDIENIVTPVDSDSSHSTSTAGTPDLQKSPIRSANRTSSPRRPASFMQSFLSALRTAQNASKLLTCSIKPDTNTQKVMDNETGSDSSAVSLKQLSSQSLLDQVGDLDKLISRFLKVCCILKSDADNILSELEDENERLCSQIQLQQQIIDQHYADFQSLTVFESNARKELKLITKDLEIANDTLHKVCDDETKSEVKKVEDELARVKLMLHRLEQMHADNVEKMLHPLQSMSTVSPLSHSQQRLSLSQYSPLWRPHHHYRHKSRLLYPFKQVLRTKDRNSTESHDLEPKLPNGDPEMRLCDSFLSNSSKSDGGEDKQQEIDYLVHHILKTFETIPDVVSSCPTLKNLYVHLNTSGPFENDVSCSPSRNGAVSADASYLANSSPADVPITTPSRNDSDLSAMSFVTAILDASAENQHIISNNMRKSQATPFANGEKDVVNVSSILECSEGDAHCSQSLVMKSLTTVSDTHENVDDTFLVTGDKGNGENSIILHFSEEFEKLSLSCNDTAEKVSETLTNNTLSHKMLSNHVLSDLATTSQNGAEKTDSSVNENRISNNVAETKCSTELPNDTSASFESHKNFSSKDEVPCMCVLSSTVSTHTVSTNTDTSFSQYNDTIALLGSTNVSVDCNANPEITLAEGSSVEPVPEHIMSDSMLDPAQLICHLTHETSL